MALQYTKTTKEIAEHIGRNYTYGMDTRLAIENLQYVAAKMSKILKIMLQKRNFESGRNGAMFECILYMWR
jgi:hypothetical protein